MIRSLGIWTGQTLRDALWHVIEHKKGEHDLFKYGFQDGCQYCCMELRNLSGWEKVS